MIQDAERFLREHLMLAPVAGVPEILIHRAHSRSRLGALLAQSSVDDPPYWAYAWAGGTALARHVLDNPQTVAGRSVLDLGAGSGVVGIAAMKAGARSVVAAETDPLGAAAIGLNAQANGVLLSICRNDLTSDPIGADVPDVEVVLAGDVFYSAPVARRMLAFLQHCRDAGLAVLVGDPGRADLPSGRLCLVARYDVPDVGGQAVSSAVYTLQSA